MSELIVGSGGGGCFAAGTLIHTTKGKVPIETIKVGDLVVSFDQYGILHENAVLATHVHTNEEVWIYDLWNTSLEATPNHWVLNQYNAFAEVGNITTEDCLVDFMGHLRPLISARFKCIETVYNLTVEVNHTFIANDIRVHNGGKGVQKPIIGSGGGGGDKGGGGRAPIVATDSLSSKQYAKILDLVCEGEIVGLVDGEKSIYLDNTPLMGSNGSYNFNNDGIQIEYRYGTQNQEPMTLFTSQEVEQSTDNREITTINPFVFRLTEPYLDKLRLNMLVPRLSKTDTGTGDVSGTDIEYLVELKGDADRIEVPVPEFVAPKFNATSNTTLDDLIPEGPSFTVSTKATVTSDSATLNVVPTLEYNLSLAYVVGTFTVRAGCRVEYKLPAASTWTASSTTTTSVLTYRYTPPSQAVYSYDDWNSYLISPASPASFTEVSREGASVLTVALPYFGTWDIRIVQWGDPWIINPGSTTVGTQYFNYETHSWVYPVTYYLPKFYPKIDKVYYSGMAGPGKLTGKASNPYRFSIEVDLRGYTFPIDVRISRITADSSDQYLQNKLLAESYTKIAMEKLSYPNSALVGMRMDSSQFTSIPSRTYDMKLLKVKIPDGYNAELRTYPSIWQGTFVVGWTDNPAWVFYDLCTNERYGLGKYISASTIDIFQLYAIAKYCDELVPDGYGGMEPRYTCNLYLQGREEAYKVLSSLAALFSSIVYWGIGAVNILSDMTSDSTFTFTNANVEEGVFNYSTGSLKGTHTVALISYIDKENSYKPAIEYVEDSDGVAKHGIKEIEVIAYGCTSRGQAHRLGRRMLLTEKLEGELLSFKTGLNAAYCRPGAIIKVQDNTLGESGLVGGRILSLTASTITLDREVTLTNGSSYSINVTLEDNTTRYIPIVNPMGELFTNGVEATYQTISIKNSVDYFNYGTNKYPTMGSIWVINKNESLDYSLWRVLGVKEADDLVYEVNCLKYDPTKASQIETGLDLPPRKDIGILDVEVPGLPQQILNPLYTTINGLPQYIDNVVVTESLYRVGKADIATKLNIGWQSMPGASEYVVKYRINSNNWIFRTINVPHVEIDNCQDAEVYEVHIFVSNIIGRLSSPYIINHTIVGKLAPPVDITGLTVTRSVRVVSLSWNASTELDFAGYEVRYFIGTTPTWETATLLVTDLQATRFDTTITGGVGTYHFLVKAKDTTGHYSVNSANTSISITTPSTPTITSSILGTNALLKVTPGSVNGTQLPILKYDIVYGTSYDTPSGDIQEGLVDTSIDTINYVSRQYWVKTIDEGNNYSLAASTTLTILDAPAVTSLAYYYKNGKIYLTWVEPVITGNRLPISYYKIYRGNTAVYTSATFIGDTTDTLYSIPVDWIVGSTEKFWVVPVDNRGTSYMGTPSSITATTIAPEAVAFSTPQQVGPNLHVSWAEPSSSLTIKHYIVKLNGTDWSTASYLGVTSSTSFYIPLSTPGTLTIRVKAVDVNNTEGTMSTTTYSYAVPAIVTNTSSIVELDQIKLSWEAPNTINVPVEKYEVLYNTSTLGFTYGSTFYVKADWSGSRTFTVRAIDTAGNVGTSTSITHTINAPAAPIVTLSFSGKSIAVNYTTPTSSLPIDKYEVRKGGTSWGVGDILVSTSTNNQVLDELHVPDISSVIYRVKAYDIGGVTVGEIGTSSISVIAPTISGVTAQAVDNNVLLYWTPSSGSLPIETYEVRRGASWSTATVIGDKSGGFTTVFETVAGTYTYWLAAIDSAGNYSSPVSRSVIVNSPPDYIFKHKYDSTWLSQNPDPYTSVTVAKTNCAIDPLSNNILAPIYTAETWATHFSTRSWTSIQDQINAGYVLFAQPSNVTSADYIEEIDYGTSVGAMKVSVSYGGTVLTGNISTRCYISYKLDSGDAWGTEIEATEVFATTFRFVKVRINILAANQQSLYNLTSLSVKLDAKAKSDAGSIYAVAEDTTGSSAVWTAGNSFADINSIGVQPKLVQVTGTLTHSIVGTVCTITCTTNNLAIGDKVYVSFTGGTPPPAGTYTLTGRTATTLVFTVVSGSGSGTPVIRIPMYGLYDFTDAPNPTGFKIYLYDIAGNRTSGQVSWTAEGY